MTEEELEPIPPSLATVHHHLKEAHRVASQVREGTTDEEDQKKLDDLLDDITDDLLTLRNIGHKGRWNE